MSGMLLETDDRCEVDEKVADTTEDTTETGNGVEAADTVIDEGSKARPFTLWSKAYI